MNYQLIYDNLIAQGKTQNLEGYVERHHIIPRCLGGSDSEDNLVRLTPEAHYVAHQLLVKMYPSSLGLAMAVKLFYRNSTGYHTNNKLYGWLKLRANRLMREYKHTPEAIQKMSLAKKGTKLSEETKARMSLAAKNMSDVTKAKMSLSKLGNKNSLGHVQSEEHKAKVSIAMTGKQNCLGRKLSEEHKARISAGNKGRIVSEETRLKIIVGNKGKKRSVETRANMSAAQKGRMTSPETKAKLSEAGKLGWLKRKEQKYKESQCG